MLGSLTVLLCSQEARLCSPIEYPKPDGIVSFDVPTSLYRYIIIMHLCGWVGLGGVCVRFVFLHIIQFMVSDQTWASDCEIYLDGGQINNIISVSGNYEAWINI